MKSPRELLFERHQAAAKDLDEIRRRVMAEQFGPEPAAGRGLEPGRHLGWVFWRELVWPCRQAWAGLAAVWVVIFFLNHASAESQASVKLDTLSPAMVTLLQEQRQLAADLDDLAPSPAADPRPARARPRSELESTHREIA